MTTRRPPGGSPPNLPDYYYPDERTGPPTRPTHVTHSMRPTRRPPPPRSSPVLVGLIYGGIGLLALAVGAVTFFVMSPPTELIRREIVAQVKAATGRDLKIAGPASFTFFPTLGVRVADVALSPPPGMGGEPFLTAASFDVGVRLLPLLRQDIVVDRLVLHAPVFALRVDAQGRKSWDMARGEARRPVRLAQAGNRALMDFTAGDLSGLDTAEPGASPPLRGLSGLSLGDIRIVDGTVRYRDERTKAAYTVEALNVRAALHSIAQPLKASGNFVWSLERIKFDGTLTSPQDVLQERPAKLALELSGRPFTLRYDGSVTLGAAPGAQGAIEGKAQSLRALARWLGSELPSAPGFREVSLAGDLRASDDAVRLSEVKLALDGATATGTIGVTTSGARPHVSAQLKVQGLNLANYVAQHQSGSSVPLPGETGEPSAPATPPAAEKPQSIEDLLERSGPQVKGYTQRSEWSSEPLDLTALGAADVDAKLSVAQLSYRDLKMDACELAVGLKERVLKTTFADVKLYQGRGKGVVTFDATRAEPALTANVQLTGIAAQPLLKDAARIDWLAGTGDATLALTASGKSEAAIVRALGGKADIAVRNGAIIGFNLAGAMRAVADGKIPELSSSPSEKTDFSELTGTFLIAGGVAKNDDLKLASPLLRATGAGTIDMPQRRLDYTVRPKLVASLAGQGGEQNLKGLEIPVHITGPWDKPDISPDISGAINNPDAVKAVKEIGKQLKGKNAGEIVEDLFGKGENGEPSKAEKLLKKFLGK